MLSTNIKSSVYHFALIVNIGSLLNDCGFEYTKFCSFPAVCNLKVNFLCEFKYYACLHVQYIVMSMIDEIYVAQNH